MYLELFQKNWKGDRSAVNQKNQDHTSHGVVLLEYSEESSRLEKTCYHSDYSKRSIKADEENLQRMK